MRSSPPSSGPPVPGPQPPPDIGVYRHGNTGVDYVTTLDGGRPGPWVAINALTHGNEVCGAVAIEALYRIGLKPARGRLTLSFANVAAYAAFDPDHPFAARFLEEDMNRVWSRERLEGSGETTVELARARQLAPILAEADVLLDLHSMTHDTAPLVLCGRTRRGRDLGLALGYPGWVVADEGHAAGRRLIDHGEFADPHGRRTGLIVECGQHWRPESAEVALETCLRLLDVLEMLDPGVATPPPPRAIRQRFVQVTHTITAASDDFAFVAPFVGLEVIAKAGTLIARDGDQPISTPYDDCVLIMPALRVTAGQTAVRLGRVEE